MAAPAGYRSVEALDIVASPPAPLSAAKAGLYPIHKRLAANIGEIYGLAVH